MIPHPEFQINPRMPRPGGGPKNCKVLDSSEPPVFELGNPDGSAPLLIACDHAENRIPRSLRNLGLEDHQLEKHIAYDIGAKQVAMQLCEMFDAPLLVAGYSRLVIDLNRHLDDVSLVADCSEDVAIPGNQGLTEFDRSRRIDHFFHPYHDIYGQMAERLANRHSAPLLLSVHSFTPIFRGHQRPWDYGVLWDDSHRGLAAKVIANFAAIDGIVVGDNKPYHACDPQGYAQVVHAEKRGMEMALIEIRQDLLDSESGIHKAAETIHRVISPLIA
jgi:predicted N-formylglutamate amidohydrolase